MSENNGNEELKKQLLQFINEDVKNVPPSTSEPSICRVPNEFREGNEKHYKPRTVAIGPFHAHDDTSPSATDEVKNAYKDTTRSLSSADELKKGYLKTFIARLPQGATTAEQVIEEVMKSEAAARECYEGVSLESYKFLKIMLLDGCFIAELLLSKNWSAVKKDSLIMARGGSLPLFNFQQDLLKLENQIPFFILESLYKLVKPRSSSSSSISISTSTAGNDQFLVESALSFFEIAMPTEHKLRRPKFDHQSVKHLLHLVKIALFPPPPPAPAAATTTTVNMPRSSSSIKTRCASELEAYGVIFKKREGDACLPEIEFRNGVLEIPQLVLEESTASLFSNLLVFELCSEEYDKRLFTSYVMFMDSLISSQKDVEVLLRSGVLQTRVNDVTGLVSFFNSLSTNVITNPKDFHFARQLQAVNAYCESGLRPLRAKLVHIYSGARWDIFNTILLFILTLTQTLFSIISYSPSKLKKS